MTATTLGSAFSRALHCGSPVRTTSPLPSWYAAMTGLPSCSPAPASSRARGPSEAAGSKRSKPLNRPSVPLKRPMRSSGGVSSTLLTRPAGAGRAPKTRVVGAVETGPPARLR